MWPETGDGRRNGRLYRIGGDGTVDTLLTEVGIPNGIAFDADRGLMYFADTPTQMVLVADYDPDTGRRSNVREFLDYQPLPGKPDGACVDADGCYWSASVYGWSVIRDTRRCGRPPHRHAGSEAVDARVRRARPFDALHRDAGAAASEPGRDGFTPGDLPAVDVGVQGRPDPLFATA